MLDTKCHVAELTREADALEEQIYDGKLIESRRLYDTIDWARDRATFEVATSKEGLLWQIGELAGLLDELRSGVIEDADFNEVARRAHRLVGLVGQGVERLSDEATA